MAIQIRDKKAGGYAPWTIVLGLEPDKEANLVGGGHAVRLTAEQLAEAEANYAQATGGVRTFAASGFIASGGAAGPGAPSGARVTILGDSITLRHWMAWGSVTVNASGGVGTITHAIPANQQPLPGQRIKVYGSGDSRSFMGEFTIATRPSNTTFTYNYAGADAVSGLTASVAVTNGLTDQSHFTFAQGLLSQRCNLVANLGVGGETSAQILARMDAQVPPTAPDILIVGAGANDLVQDLPQAALLANWTSIIAKAAGMAAKVVVINTAVITARGAAAAAAKTHVDIEAAKFPNVSVVDAFTISVDPASGATYAPKAGYLHDGVHWGQRMAFAVAQAEAEILGPILPAYVGPQGTNRAASGFMDGAVTSGVPAGWTVTSTTMASAVRSVVPNADGPGNMLRVVGTADGAGDSVLMEHGSIHAALTAGKRYRLWSRVKTTGLAGLNSYGPGLNLTAGGVSHTIRALIANPDGSIQTDFVDSNLLLRTDWFTCPVGLTAAVPRCAFAWRVAGGGTVEIGEFFVEEEV